MRDGAVSAAVEAGDRVACLQDVDEDRRDEQGRDHVCLVVCGNLGNSISVQVLHCGELHSIFSGTMAEHLAFRQRLYLFLSCMFM